MKSYRPYELYKSTDIRWLNNVPQHWEVKPLFGIANERKRKNSGLVENNVLSLSYGKIVKRNVDTDFGLLPASFETYNIVRPKNIILRLSDLQNDKRSLRTGLAKEKGIITSAYVCLEVLKEYSAEYIHYLLHAYDIEKVFYSMGGGVRQSMGYDDLRRLPITLPPKTEQKTIASFLDRETAHIDALIEKKKRLIELLQEKRQAIITQAVTKGLVPSVPMKDSWIGWLGEVPEHWEIVHIKRALERSEYGISASLDETEGVAVLRMGNLKDGEISLDNLAFMEHVPDSLLLQADDLLFNRTNSLALVGRVGIFRGSNFPVTFASYLVRLITRPNFSKGYLCFLLNQPSVLALARSMALPAIGQANLNPNRYGYMRICKPPFDEQKAIAAALYKMEKKMTTIIGKIETSINLLKERRSALITTAVTGQIDVREEVA